MSGTWVAEDLPAYMFDPSMSRPRSDDAANATRPRYHAENATEGEARAKLVRHLMYLANLGISRAGNMSHWYTAAGIEISNGARMVRIEGRVFRLRDTTWCDRGAQFHGMCPSCDPLNYASFTREGI